MIAWFRTRAALIAELAELRDTAVTQAAQLEVLRAEPAPAPVDWSRLAHYFDDADQWVGSETLAQQTWNDQALASWREAFTRMGLDLDDEQTVATVAAGLIAAGTSAHGYACSRAAGPMVGLLCDHTVGWVAQAVMTLLQFRPKETT